MSHGGHLPRSSARDLIEIFYVLEVFGPAAALLERTQVVDSNREPLPPINPEKFSRL